MSGDWVEMYKAWNRVMVQGLPIIGRWVLERVAVTVPWYAQERRHGITERKRRQWQRSLDLVPVVLVKRDRVRLVQVRGEPLEGIVRQVFEYRFLGGSDDWPVWYVRIKLDNGQERVLPASCSYWFYDKDRIATYEY